MQHVDGGMSTTAGLKPMIEKSLSEPIAWLLKREKWGFSLWHGKEQVGAAVGVPITTVWGAPLSEHQLQTLEKDGTCALPSDMPRSASSHAVVRSKSLPVKHSNRRRK